MLAADDGGNFDESYSPILSVTVDANGNCAANGNPGDFGPGTIERNQENGCDNLEGLARFSGASYGRPWGLAVSNNVADDSWDVDLIEFIALPQQGTTTGYAGDFGFWELTDDGYGMGHVFFFDYSGLTAYSLFQHFETFWVDRDFGSGGQLWNSDNSFSVDIPAEWTDDNTTDEDAIVMWKSRMARPAVWQDFILTPVGDNNGMMNYITDPSCESTCGDDEQYAIINMQYNNATTTTPDSLMVAWWDGEGQWRTDNVYFPSTVRGFYTSGGQNWVEFAVTCFGNGDDAWYSVVMPTPYTGSAGVTRAAAYPFCNDYVGTFPTFWYQFTEAFAATMDWSTLEIKFDGVRIYYDDYYGDAPGKRSRVVKTVTDGVADYWEVEIDEIAAKVSVEYIKPCSEDADGCGYDDPSDVNLPLTCRDHTIWIGARDSQLRLQYLNDQFEVDCDAPDVDFANSYVSKNPTIAFDINDADAGVDWNSVNVDVFFVNKGDDNSPKEKVAFMQTFYPDQIKDYLDGNTVTIPTRFDLENQRAIVVVIYSSRGVSNPDTIRFNSDDPSAWDNYDEFYSVGALDCVGNGASPYMQYLPVDNSAPSITLQTSGCPMLFIISDDGAGFTGSDIEILEDGATIEGGEQESASDVDAGGEWYFAASGNGGRLWYCPNDGVDFEIRVTDEAGNVAHYFAEDATTITDDDITDGWAGPNPFDPDVDGSVTVHFDLGSGANVTVAIYDMAGDFVANATMVGNESFSWDGMTEDGTRVAKGAYFAHIEAKGTGGGTASAVVKIAVVEK
jgi:hypothetical protein